MLDVLYAAPFNLALFVFLAGCVGLDLLFGDPKDWPHPVRLLGLVMDRLEGWARRCWLGPTVGGGVVVVGLAGLCFAMVAFLTGLPLLGELLALYLGYAGLAWGCLLHETSAVLALLDGGDLPAARAHLAGLVSRDTADMDESEAYRALGETLAENFNDGFVAPLFWLALFGPAALWAYKMVSTADSMWGYRTERFERVGKVGARLDDVLAWIPARLAALCIWLAGWLLLRPSSLRSISREARTMDSPNAGWPMAAVAQVVRVGMGGSTRYFGEIKDKPSLGPDRPWNGDAIRTTRRVLILAAGLGAFFLVVVGSWMAWWTLG